MSANGERRMEVMLRYLDGSLSGAEVEELGALLRTDPQARREFARLLVQHGQLGELAAGQLPVAGSSSPRAATGAKQRSAALQSSGQDFAEQGKAAGSRPPAAPVPSILSLQPSTCPTPPPPALNSQPAARRASLRARLSWIAIGAAAAVILVVSGLHVLGVLPTRYTTIEIFGPSGGPKEHRLYDGTVVTAAPGARAEALGTDDARRVRQLIRLESGEIEVRAPKAAAGEVACRVETSEGLWVETVGTVFKVTRAWEDEKGERNVDKSKLTGAAIAAVLLVAVSDGEVRTGNAVAGESRVAAGNSTEVHPAEDSAAVAAKPKAMARDAFAKAYERSSLGFVGKVVKADLTSKFWSGDVMVTSEVVYDVESVLKGEAGKQVAVHVVVLMGSRLMARDDKENSQPGLDTKLFAVGARHIVCAKHPVAEGEVDNLVESSIWPATDENLQLARSVVRENVSWGQAVGGLKLGLSVAAGPVPKLTLHFDNTTKEELKLNVGAAHRRPGPRPPPIEWEALLTPAAGGAPLRLRLAGGGGLAGGMEKEGSVIALPAGQSTPFKPMEVASFEDEAEAMALSFKAVPPGKYTATAAYQHLPHVGDCPCWHGRTTAGPVEVVVGEDVKAGAEAVKPLEVDLDKDGKPSVAGKVLTAAELGAEVGRKAKDAGADEKGRSKAKVVIRPAAGAPWSAIVAVVTECMKAKITDITVLTVGGEAVPVPIPVDLGNRPLGRFPPTVIVEAQPGAKAGDILYTVRERHSGERPDWRPGRTRVDLEALLETLPKFIRDQKAAALALQSSAGDLPAEAVLKIINAAVKAGVKELELRPPGVVEG